MELVGDMLADWRGWSNRGVGGVEGLVDVSGWWMEVIGGVEE